MLHQLKIDTSYFEMKVRGVKRWEIREDDRGFLDGDYIALNETVNGQETGRFMIERITAIVREAPGLREGFVLLSTAACSIVNCNNAEKQELYGVCNRGERGIRYTRFVQIQSADIENMPNWFVEAVHEYISRRHMILGFNKTLEDDVKEFMLQEVSDEV